MFRFLIAMAGVFCARSADLRAQDGVFLGGQIKVGVDSLRYSGGKVDDRPVANPRTPLGVSDNASWIYVRGEESLGAQTAVFFHLEYGLLVTSGEMGTPLSGLVSRPWV
jgi:predicted porin